MQEHCICAIGPSIALAGSLAAVVVTFFSLSEPNGVLAMLLWKTEQSPSVRTEIFQGSPAKRRSVRRESNQVSRAAEYDVDADVETHDYGTNRDDEERYIFKMVLMMLLVLVVPGILLLLYLVINPDSF